MPWRPGSQGISDEIGSDEPGAAGDEDGFIHVLMWLGG
jgi:hypothetical protein